MIIALVCVGILVIALLFLCHKIYSIAFKSPHPKQNELCRLPKDFNTGIDRDEFFIQLKERDAIPYQRVSTRSADNLLLQGRYYHAGDGYPVAICFHGYRSLPTKDFFGALKSLPPLKFNILAVEQRAHCGSEGKTITFGIKEKYDCIQWIKYVNQRFGADTPILLYGVSMGAATVLLASGSGLLTKNVKCVIADCPYSSPRAIIRKVTGDMGFPVRLAYPLVCLSAGIFGSFWIGKESCTDAAKRSPVPILLIHGEKDDFVPTDMSREIAADNPSVQLLTVPEATHAISYMINEDLYMNTVKEFLSKNM